MKCEIKDGKLTIDVADLAESLSTDDKRELARQLIADKELFAAVLDCVVRGEYFADDDRGAWWFDADSVLRLREQLLPMMSEIAAEAVKTAVRQRDHEKKVADEYQRWAFAMYHAWPEGHTMRRPELPTFRFGEPVERADIG